MVSLQSLWVLLKNGGAEFVFVISAAIGLREYDLINFVSPDLVDWFVIGILISAFGDAIRRILSKIIYEEFYKRRQWQHERDNYAELYIDLKEEHKTNGISFKQLLQEGSTEKLLQAKEQLVVKTLLTGSERKIAKNDAKINILRKRIEQIKAEQQ